MSLVIIRAILWAAALCALAAASSIDLRRRIIPNEASAFVAASGLALSLFSRPGTAWISLTIALGLLLALTVVAHVAGMGGGDVKLIAAVSLLAPPQGLAALLIGIALAGGLLSLVYLALRRLLTRPAASRPAPHRPRRHGRLARFLRGERARIRASRTVPYSLAIFAGVILYVLSELPQCSSETHCLL